jgi:hypothetical protein
VLSCEKHRYWIKDSSWKANGTRQTSHERVGWMMFYVDFERGVSVSFVFIRSLFGCQPEHLESLSSDTSADSRLSGRHQYAPSMNPCRQDVRSCMGTAQERARLTGLLGWLCLKGVILLGFDRLVAYLKPDLLTIWKDPEMTPEVSSETNHFLDLNI